jgi:molybdopterin-guanine dinucleotide biosynthesis protein A
MTSYPCSGIILANEAPRHSDKDRTAFVEVGGRKVLDWLVDLLGPLFKEIIVVAQEPLAYMGWDVSIVRDGSHSPNALTGLHAGLFASGNPHALATTCDMPVLQPQIVQLLLDTTAPRWDAIVAATEAGIAPFPGVYSKRCVKLLETILADERLGLKTLIKQAHCTTVSIDAVRALDPELISFLNIQSTEQLAQAEAWIRQQQRKG